MARGASAHWKSGDKAYEQLSYTTVLASYEKAHGLDGKIHADRWVKWGLSLMAVSRYAEARTKFKEVFGEFPDDHQAHKELGQLESKLGNHRTAVNHFLKALPGSPADPEIYDGLKRSVPIASAPEEVLAQTISTVAGLDNAEADLLWAATLDSLGYFRDARNFFDAAIQKQPDNPKVYIALAVFLAPHKFQFYRSYYKSKPVDSKAAALLYEKAVQLDNTLESVYFDWAEVLMDSGQMKDGIDKYFEACNRFLTDPDKVDEFNSRLLELARAVTKSEPSDSENQRIHEHLENFNQPEVMERWEIEKSRLKLEDLVLKKEYVDALDMLMQFISQYPSISGNFAFHLSNIFAADALKLTPSIIKDVESLLQQKSAQLPEVVYADWAEALFHNEHSEEASSNMMIAIQRSQGDTRIDYLYRLANFIKDRPDLGSFLEQNDFQSYFGPADSKEQHLGFGNWLGLGLKKPDLAIRSFALAESKANKDPQIHANWGFALIELRQYREAADHFRQAMTLSDGEAYHAELAEAFYLSKQYDKTWEAIQTASEKGVGIPKALEILEQLIESDRDHQHKVLQLQAGIEEFADAQMFAKWVDILNKAKFYMVAIRTCCKGIHRFPDGAFSFYGALYDLFNSLIKFLPHIEAMDSQIEDIKQSLKQLNSATAHFHFGRVLYSLRRFKDGVEYLTLAFDESETRDSYYQLIIAYDYGEQYEKAISLSQKAFERWPDFWNLYERWTSSLIGLGREGEAVERCREGVGHVTDSMRIWVLFNWGLAATGLGNYQQAMEKYEQAAKIDPGHPFFVHNVANLLVRQGLYEEAIKKWSLAKEVYLKYLKGKERDFWSSNVFSYFSDVLYGVFQEFNEAERYYLKALSINPQLTQALEGLMDLYIKSKDWDAEGTKEWKVGRGKVRALAQKSGRRSTWQIYNQLTRILEDQIAREDCSGDRLQLARVQNMMNENDKALGNLELILEDSSRLSLENYAAVQALIASIHIKNDEAGKAITALQFALSSQPNNLDYQSSLADAYLKDEKKSIARDKFEKILQVAPHHIVSIIGLGDVLTAMADEKKEKKEDEHEAEGLYSKAIEQYEAAIDLQNSGKTASKVLTPKERSSLYYSRGYTRVMLSELREKSLPATRIFFNSEAWNHLRKAKSDFQKVHSASPDFIKARRAVEKINEKIRIVPSPWSLPDILATVVVVIPALFVFVVAQIGILHGTPQFYKESFVLTKKAFEEVTKELDKKKIAIIKPKFEKLIPQMKGEYFLRENFLKALENELSGKEFELLRGAFADAALNTTSFRFGKPMEVTSWLGASFSALLFVIAGLFLRQLSKLKVGPIQLDKSSMEQIRSSGSMGLKR